MKKRCGSKVVAMSLVALMTFGMSMSAHAEGQGAKKANSDTEILMTLVKKARFELMELRAQQGLKKVNVSFGEKREGRGEHREGRERGEGRREGRERGESHNEGRERSEGHREGRERGESHNEGRERNEGIGELAEGGEESQTKFGKYQKCDMTRQGARLVLAYEPTSQSFKGMVVNVSKKVLKDVRVEVHLSNGKELGPTERKDLKPGEKMAVELAANSERFNWWVTHPENGTEEGHGPGHEGEGNEHGAGGEGKNDSRPKAGGLRPLHNQLMLLCKEIEVTKKEMSKKKR
ncbi:hypothetical protein JD969_02025 [Planctomycetota bacterium]|nr:hypothetical protein JD969_02025 [Planctomycetota bacterium]